MAVQSDSTGAVAEALQPVLVTGATGNTGRAVVAELRRLSVPFVAAGSDPHRTAAALGVAQARRLDFRDPGTYDAAVQGMRGLFLLRPPPIADVKRTLNVLVDRALAAGVRHVAFLSVMGAERQRWVPHHRVEQHLLQRGVSATLLRAGFFAQNLGDAYRADLRERSELRVPAGRGRAAFVDVRDVGALAARSFVEPALRGQALTLTGPEALSFHDVAAQLTEALGQRVVYRPLSAPGYILHLRRRGRPWPQALVQTVLHLGLRLGNARHVDPSLARWLGRPPRTLRDYIQDHLALWQA